MVKLGRVAIDSTRVAANASRDRVDSEQGLRDTRARLCRQVRAWQKEADRDAAEPGGLEVAIAELNQALAEMPRRMERLQKSGLKKLSRSDEDARFLRQRGGFTLGYTGEIAVSDDHLIVAQRVTQNATDNGSLAPMIDQVSQCCGAPPGAALADSGFFSIENIEQMEARNIDAYVPDSNLASELNLGARCRKRACAPAHRRLRGKLRSPVGKAVYARRKAIVEPVFGVLKQQRGMRQFRTRGLHNVNNEFTLATLAFNLTRLHALRAT
jgi:Transposase DDE domain